MLIHSDCTGKIGSTYECDRCKKQIHTKYETKYRVTIYRTPRDYAKTDSWDLCDKCYRALRRGIKKGVTRKNDTNIQSTKSNN